MWELSDNKVTARNGWYLIFSAGKVTTANIARLTDITGRKGVMVWGPLSRNLTTGENWFATRWGILA